MTAKRIFLSHWKVVAIPQYRAIHYWIERRKGKPSYCELCKSKDKKVYHWANKSGKYLKDLSEMKLLAVRDPFPSSQTIAEALDLPEAYIELIHYILCSADLCEYGTSPRSCWPEDDKKFQEFITSCELYYKRVWESDGK